MSTTVNFSQLSPVDAAFVSLPPGNQYTAEFNQIYRDSFTTKHGADYNVSPRDQIFANIGRYPMDQFAAITQGLNCKNTNTLGARPDKGSLQYGGSCASSARYPYYKSASSVINTETAFRQSPIKYTERQGMYNVNIGDVDVSTTLLGSPPPAVQMNAFHGSIIENSGPTRNTMTALNSVPYPPAMEVGAFAPLPQASMTAGACLPQRNPNISACSV